MKNQIHFSSDFQSRPGETHLTIHQSSVGWRTLLLTICCGLLAGLGWPTRGAVIEAWVQRYSNLLSNSTDQANGVAIDAAGDVIVTGGTGDYITGLDMLTIKYSGVDGSMKWQQLYNGPANGEDVALALVVDRSGNAIVTGYSYGLYSGVGDSDYYTAKYAAADGTLLWEKRYNGPANREDCAQAVAVDSNGNVVVAGSSQSNAGVYYTDDYTVKYAGADGALLWEKRYNGSWNADDFAQAVAVDGSGNVVVTGITDSSVAWRSGDYYTAKYAASDGTLLWERRYNGPGNGTETIKTSQSLALGQAGMAAIAGSSLGNFGDVKTTTVVYRENLPPVSIELVPTGIRLRFTGVPGRNYTIERGPSVTGPWSTLAAPTTPIGGIIEYIDTNPPVSTAFYRMNAQ